MAAKKRDEVVEGATRNHHWHATLTYLGSSRYESDKRFTGARPALQDAEEIRLALEKGGLVVHTTMSRVPSTIQRHLAVDADGNQVAVIEVTSCSRASCAPEPGDVTEESGERPPLTLHQAGEGA